MFLGAFGFTEFMVGLMLAVVGAIGLRASRMGRANGGPTLALTRFAINDVPGSPVAVEIVGRAAGFIGWLLGVLRLGAETSLLVTDRQVVFRAGGLAGEIHHIIPMSAIASMHCGFAKPLWALVLSLLFGFGGLYGLLTTLSDYSPRYGDSTMLSAGLFGVLVNLLIAAGFGAFYFFRRTLAISVESDGGLMAGLSFKRSIVENVPVDLPQTIAAIKAINTRVQQARS